jgi:drug/metabolite transporter (DMT)-like permease
MFATGLGLGAVAIWGSTIAVMRSVVEQLGVVAAGAYAFLIGGAVGLAFLSRRRGGIRALAFLPRTYLVGGGLLFVVTNVTLFMAIDMAASRAEVVGVGLVNYLWPALTLALAVPILKKKVRLTLWLGLAVALAGVYLAMMQGEGVSPAALRRGALAHPWPFLLAGTSALIWSLYSNLARRWAGHRGGSGIPLFVVWTGLVLGAILVTRTGSLPLPGSVRGTAELIYLGVFPMMVAYWFWDIAMRRGHHILVGTASFFIPLISTILSSLYLGVEMGADLWLASGLIVAGAIVCKMSFRSD